MRYVLYFSKYFTDYRPKTKSITHFTLQSGANEKSEEKVSVLLL